MYKDQQLLERAAQLASNGRFESAIPLFTQLVQKYPQQAEIAMQLANALGYTGRWDEAKAMHKVLLDRSRESSGVLVRIARDLEEWRDYNGALTIWRKLAEKGEAFSDEGKFHAVRLLERVNQIPEAVAHWSEWGGNPDVWGNQWLSGRLAARSGDLSAANGCFQKAFDLAQGDFKLKCASELIRNCDRMGEYGEAWKWMQWVSCARREASSKLKGKVSLKPLGGQSMPKVIRDSGKGGGAHRPLIMLVGLPRSGTTLLAHRLREFYQVCLSEEFDYMKQLVQNVAYSGAKVIFPDRIRLNAEVSKHIRQYWQSQRLSAMLQSDDKNLPMIDKNPAMEALLPWVGALFPKVKIIWMERDPRDAWLSSVSMDVPVNPVSCWWQNPQDYGQWCSVMATSRKMLMESMPENQFIKIDYKDMVSDLPSTLKKVGEKFGLQLREREENRLVATSPSYEEVTKPVDSTRTERWQKYRPLMEGDLLAAFDDLPERFS